MQPTQQGNSMKRLLITSALVTFLSMQSAVAASAKEAADGKWMVRLRAIDIAPDESSTISPIGGKADFSNEVVPELDFTYFFNKNIAAELILATSKHTAKAHGTAVGTVDVGEAWVLPPTLTLQYHFTNFDGFKPYVGAGINYTMYYNEDGGSQPKLEIEDAFGLALQVGFDVPIEGNWGWNFDVKKIYLDADSKWNNGAIVGNIALDPWIIGTGVSYRF